jgi:three-Cys-motif partner protein
MVKVPYKWSVGASLGEHSRRKHKILREYLRAYLRVRCSLPRERFRIAIVDGFAGAGQYDDGALGSPLIMLEELRLACDAINSERAEQGARALEIECLLLLNDADEQALRMLRDLSESRLAAINDEVPRLHVSVRYLNSEFEVAYPEIKSLIASGRYRNAIFNLDQYGYAKVSRATMRDIMASTASAEIIYTFAIESLLAFLSKTDPSILQQQLRPFGFGDSVPADLDNGLVSNRDWLGAAERLVFSTFRSIAAFSSPFSINNPDGWRYWLIHFANSFRARQVYNNVLHQNASYQAHFGRSGLNMLAYDPARDAGLLYLFEQQDRVAAHEQLLTDIPRFVTEVGDMMSVGEFYDAVYNATAAHSDDIHAAMIGSGELHVLTAEGGERRRANTIAITDTLKLRHQRSLFPMFFSGRAKIPKG